MLAAATPFGFASGTRLQIRIDHLDGTIGQGIGRFRIWVTDVANPLEVDRRARKVLAIPAERTTAQADELAAVFRTTTPLLKETRDTLAARRKALADLKIPSTLVMREHVSFERPSFERVAAVLGEGRAGVCRHAACAAGHARRSAINRLGLARWLVDPNSPLVARVAVNRLWEQIFGRGLVETKRGLRLPGLAAHASGAARLAGDEFVAKKCGPGRAADDRSVGHLSPVVRCSTAALAERDPYNRLFARGPASGSKRR